MMRARFAPLLQSLLDANAAYVERGETVDRGEPAAQAA